MVDDLRAPGTPAIDTTQPRARLVKIFGRIVYVAWLDSSVDEPAETSASDLGLRPLALAISSMIGALAIVNASGLGASAFLALWLAISLVLLLIGHAHARDEGRPATSVLSSLLMPRAYRGSRRLIVIGLVAELSASAASSGPGPLLVVVAAIFVADRLTPVVDVREEPVPGGGRSRWLRAVTILGSTGLIVLAGLLFALPAALRASNLDHKVRQVLTGQRLAYSPLNPLALAEPRAEPVQVRWVAANPPPLFHGRDAATLTYLGQNAGTSVFLDTRTVPTVHRLPTSALTVQSAARSIL